MEFYNGVISSQSFLMNYINQIFAKFKHTAINVSVILQSLMNVRSLLYIKNKIVVKICDSGRGQGPTRAGVKQGSRTEACGWPTWPRVGRLGLYASRNRAVNSSQVLHSTCNLFCKCLFQTKYLITTYRCISVKDL